MPAPLIGVRLLRRMLFFGLWFIGTVMSASAATTSEVRAGKKVDEVIGAFDQDHEYDAGSKVVLRTASSLQVENLATLAHVWGFLKYHHPRITSGQFHWDYELFRIMPVVLDAPDRETANEALAQWIERLGDLTSGSNPELPLAGIYLRPDIAWIDDAASLGKHLSERLRAVYHARLSGRSQFYLSLHPYARNPVFDHEPDYSQLKFPDAGYQLLALFRFWNIIRYWAPYRDLIDENWDTVLTDFIPRFAQPATSVEYQLALLAFSTKIHDTHTFIAGPVRARPPLGECTLPAVIRFIEGHPTVVQPIRAHGADSPPLQRGDVILALGHQPVETLVAGWSPYYGGSNEAARWRDLGFVVGRGPAGLETVTVQRSGTTLDLSVSRVPFAVAKDPNDSFHDLPGPAFRMLSKEIAYLKLCTAKDGETESYLEKAAGTKGWILDLRDYPSDNLMVTLGSHLVAQPTDTVLFTYCDPSNPGAFYFGKTPLGIEPQRPRYLGKIVILVDEVSQSAAEFTAMFFRAAPGAVVVGSTTAGADGNLSNIPLPGGRKSAISGLGVFYPDKRSTQRVGIVPDVNVRPSLAGIRTGRDEVLEVAIRQILGADKSDSEVRQLIPSSE